MNAPLMNGWTLLQLADSALPTGGFAHSGGLEAALQLGRLEGGAGLERFVEEALWNVGAAALPFVAASHAAPERIAPLDAHCDAAIPSAVANRASRIQGQAFLRAAAAAHPEPLRALAREVDGAQLAAHLATVFGAALRLLGSGALDARRLFLFHGARGVISSAIRLGLVGPLEAQRLLSAAGRTGEEVLVATEGRTPDDAAATSPLLDLWQSHQDRLYSRLFRS
jgi:urease accessory protein